MMENQEKMEMGNEDEREVGGVENKQKSESCWKVEGMYKLFSEQHEKLSGESQE